MRGEEGGGKQKQGGRWYRLTSMERFTDIGSERDRKKNNELIICDTKVGIGS